MFVHSACLLPLRKGASTFMLIVVSRHYWWFDAWVHSKSAKNWSKKAAKFAFCRSLRLRSHRRMNLYILHTTRQFIPSEGLHSNARCYSCQVINSGGVRTGTIDPFPHIVWNLTVHPSLAALHFFEVSTKRDMILTHCTSYLKGLACKLSKRWAQSSSERSNL